MTHSRRLSGLVLSTLLTLGPTPAPAQTAVRPARPWPLTRPESTNHVETSRYEDVVAYMKAMASASPKIHLTTYGYTYEGRALPKIPISNTRP